MKKTRLLGLVFLAALIAISLVTVSNAQQSHMTRVGGNYITIGYWGQPPSICSVCPAFGFSGCTAFFSVFGKGFKNGARVELVLGNRVILACSANVICPSCIICMFDLRGAAAGCWDVRVTNPDGGSATLRKAFLVIGCSLPKSLDSPETPIPKDPDEGLQDGLPALPGEEVPEGSPDEQGKKEEETPSSPAPQDPVPSEPQEGLPEAGEEAPEPPPRKGNDGIDFFPRSGRIGQVINYEITGYAYDPNLLVILRRGEREVVSLNSELKDGVIRGWIPLEYVWAGPWEIILQPPGSDPVPVNGGFLVCE